MPKVLVSDKLSDEGLGVLKAAEGIEVDYKTGLKEEELAKIIGSYEALVIRSASNVTARVIEAAGKLRVIGRAGIGVDNVDVKAATRRGIVVMNTPTGNAVTTAEHAIALLMALARKLPQACAAMKQGNWEKTKFQGRELAGKTLGVVGLGNIGRIVADRARGLQMQVVGYDPVVTPDCAAELGIELVSLDTLFERADAVSVHTPLTPETKALVDDAAIARMKKGVLLVNAARGGIYDEAALLRGLESGKLGGVALDVFVEEPPGKTPLVEHPNAIVTPHLGASTEEAQLRVAVEIAHQVVAYLQSGTVSNSVNMPSIPRELAPILGPYLTLARRLGLFLGQVEGPEPRLVEVEVNGDAAELPTRPIVNAALSGLLEKFFAVPVNHVNAPMIAADRGIEIKELKSSERGGYVTLVSVSVTGPNGERNVLSGTLAADRTPRLVRWGAYELDANLEGSILVMKNLDRPGVIGSIGTILGQSSINVSRMQMGLDTKSSEAASLWALDCDLPHALLDKIRAVRDVKQAYHVFVA